MNTAKSTVTAFTLLYLLWGCEGAQLPTINGFNLQALVNAGSKVVEANRDYTEPEEVAMGHSVASVLLGAARLDPNQPLQRYVNRVGRWVANQTERRELAWHFGVLDDTNINAYAAPGGYIFVTRGLINLMENEAELAGVLGHEIAHVLRQHHLKAMRSGSSQQAFSELVGFAAERYRHRSGDAMKGEMAKRFLATTQELYTRGLDRGDEFEADRMGVILAARAGYDPFALMAVLQKIEQRKPGDRALSLMFKTHPAPADRLMAIERTLGDVKLPELAIGERRFQAQFGR